MTKSKIQGELDGLCGLYAVYNSYRLLCGKLSATRSDKLLKTLMRSMKADFVDAYVDGISFQDVGNMTLAAIAFAQMHGRIHLGMSRPFWKGKVADVDDYWKRLDAELDQGRSVAIIGLGDPEPHWTVVKHMTRKRMHLFDSDGETTSLERGRLSLGSGRKKQKRKRPIDYRQTIILRRLDADGKK